jgi:hypothetical protein
METFEDTLDNYMSTNTLSTIEWSSILMQVIMSLITLQKTFLFTHNDLHTNNIMFISTEEEYLFYKFNNITYRVPTFGKIYKIIDFGRAIFTLKGKRFCSDCFEKGNDAATQYNTEPFFDSSKKRLDPNYSFDLCRLACSIIEQFIDSNEDVLKTFKPESIDNPIFRLVSEWCLDDNNKSIIFRKNGDERFPDFQLYKMISKCVNNHVPKRQLERDLFKTFIYEGNASNLMDIDNIPSMY